MRRIGGSRVARMSPVATMLVAEVTARIRHDGSTRTVAVPR